MKAPGIKREVENRKIAHIDDAVAVQVNNNFLEPFQAI
jgi:hypothetical protein